MKPTWLGQKTLTKDELRTSLFNIIVELNQKSSHCSGILHYLWKEYAQDDPEMQRLLMMKMLAKLNA
jgi:hypothetical protein